MGLDASFKVFVKDSDRYLETGLGSCFLNQFFDNVIVRKDNALNGVMDMGKKPMLDGVPFRGVGRVMADQNVLSDGFGELEHLLFESMVPARVAPRHHRARGWRMRRGNGEPKNCPTTTGGCRR